MSDLQIIEATLERAARRRRLERAFRGLWQGVLWGAVLWLTVLALYKVLPIPFWTLTTASAAAVAAAFLGFIIGGWRKSSVAEIARWIDGKQRLQERLSTALEVSREHRTGTWEELVVTDAVAHARNLDPRRLVQFRLPKASRWALIVLALAAGLGFVPEYRSKAYVEKQADQKVIKEVGRQLTDLTKRSLQSHKPVIEETQKSMDAVNELGDHLTRQSLTRSDALKDLANVTDKLKDQLNELGKDPDLKRMEQAARASNGSTSPEVARLQKQIDDAQKQLGTPTGTPEDMEKMQQAMDKIQAAAKAAMDKNGGMTPADKEKLSQSLTALSKQAQDMGLQMPNLDQAIQSLAAAQTDMFMKDLNQAGNDLEKTKEMAKSLQQMQQQMDKMGKDLAEQLKNGQPELAKSTLDKMVQQLQSANLTPEQLQKLTDEVSKAVDPAGDYGKVADHLKDATAKLQQGQKPAAAQSLAAASKELEQMMQQMGDAQALSAELDALKQASTCVGTGESWGQCKGNGPPKAGHGGKPGHGVGTWADEDSGWGYNPQAQSADKWDNSGVVRPDMKGKGLSDRGEGDLNDALKPTKVKGQFSPGGQMPSITLKGVSIKGESKVAYEESATAAQADAQSALSQEKVPRAYQGAVRDYFDDLKK
jgi:uncharacterized protein with von Willebrand factor type A (vWA) domain